MQSQTAPFSERTRVRRRPQRGVYDRETIAAILDEAMLAHVGFLDDGAPVVIPTAFGRDGDDLYLHGAVAARWARAFAEGSAVCVTVTLLDGLVLARSTFHHSMNYRSVVVLGRATLVEDREEKLRGLECIVEHLVPGRSRDARPPTRNELDATALLKLSLEESSAKVRTGPPIDDEEDLELQVWAGVIPARTTFGPPLADEFVGRSLDVPGYVRSYAR